MGLCFVASDQSIVYYGIVKEGEVMWAFAFIQSGVFNLARSLGAEAGTRIQRSFPMFTMCI